MNITLGNAVTLATTSVVLDAAGGSTPTDDAGLVLNIKRPDGGLDAFTQSDRVVHDGVGQYHAIYVPTQLGVYSWEWLGDVVSDAAEGTFTVESIFVGAVTDMRDLRVLVPSCRRAIDGPQATTPDAASTTLTDQEVLNLVADATADLILFTAETFGFQLVVTGRDPYYKAPTLWATNTERSTAADAAIISQAAINHYFWLIKLLKVSETQKNEAVEWTYSLSPNVLTAYLQYLIGNRDRALAAMQQINLPADVYFSLVAERDRLSAAWLEPWVTEIGAPVPYVGGGGSGPLEYDYRFNTWG